MLRAMTASLTSEDPTCPSCGKPMLLVRVIPGIGGLAELRVYSCKTCGVSVTRAADAGDRASGYQSLPA